MRQSIETSYRGPTETLGARIVARSSGGHRLTLSYDDGLSSEANHTAAAFTLASELAWFGGWDGGGSLSGKGYVYVCRGSQPDFEVPR